MRAGINPLGAKGPRGTLEPLGTLPRLANGRAGPTRSRGQASAEKEGASGGESGAP